MIIIREAKNKTKTTTVKVVCLHHVERTEMELNEKEIRTNALIFDPRSKWLQGASDSSSAWNLFLLLQGIGQPVHRFVESGAFGGGRFKYLIFAILQRR